MKLKFPQRLDHNNNDDLNTNSSSFELLSKSINTLAKNRSDAVSIVGILGIVACFMALTMALAIASKPSQIINENVAPELKESVIESSQDTK